MGRLGLMNTEILGRSNEAHIQAVLRAIYVKKGALNVLVSFLYFCMGMEAKC